MRVINESIDVSCSTETLFQSLLTPSDICMCWNARTAVVVPQVGGLWVAAWGKNEDRPELVTIARFKVLDPPRVMVQGDFEYWVSGQLLPFASPLSATIRVEPWSGGARLLVTHEGFSEDPADDEFFRDWCQRWTTTLAAIKDFF